MAKPPPLDPLFAALGRAVDRALIDRALTHPSASSPARPHYQRLEFLGDRVLNLMIAEALFHRFPDEAEGVLALRLNDLVRKETCAAVAEALDLGRHLRLERAEARAGGRKRVATLADAMEAVLAAVYLDGGEAAARDVVRRLWGPHIDAQGAAAPQDAKTALQEWAQARGMAPPRYETLRREGPDHAPRFTVAARLADGAEAVAEAANKRSAEQAAAADLLERVSNDG
jgi:ribonuclease-3